jgi:hypothetical protein
VAANDFGELALRLRFDLGTFPPPGTICLEEHEVDELAGECGGGFARRLRLRLGYGGHGSPILALFGRMAVLAITALTRSPVALAARMGGDGDGHRAERQARP